MTATPLRLPSDPHDPYGPSDGQPATWWRLRWSNAGHPHPLLITPTGIVTTLTCGPNDLPIGVDPTRARTDHTTTVPDGCTLLLFTDGLTEHRRHTTGHQQLTRLANQFAVKLQSEQLTEHLGRVTARRTYYPHPATLVQRILTALEPLLDADEATLLAARLHTRAAASPAPPPRRAGKPAEIHGPTTGGPTAITSTRYHLRAA